MGVNFLCAYINERRRARGENVPDPEEQYRALKADMPTIEEQYRLGNVPEEIYKKYVQAIEMWEKD